mgnify:CR=1 FL=1
MKSVTADFEDITLTIGSYLSMINDPMFTSAPYTLDVYSSSELYSLLATSDDVSISFTIKKKGGIK